LAKTPEQEAKDERNNSKGFGPAGARPGSFLST